MKKVCGFGEVIDGKLVLRNESTFREQLAQMKGSVDVVVEKARTRRSLNQNAYYWGVVLKLISDHTGYEIDEVHELMKVMFNWKAMPTQEVDEDGTVSVDNHRIGKSTTKLSTIDFMAYVEQIQRWASQNLGVVIPDPNEESETAREQPR